MSSDAPPAGVQVEAGTGRGIAATAILMQEHELIEEGLGLLRVAAHRARQGARLPSSAVSALLGFFHDFADGTHHCKEERVLFGALRRVGVPCDEGPLAELESDHRQGRLLSQQLRELSAIMAGSEDARRQFSEVATAYLALIADHIWRENNLVFPLAERLLGSWRDAELVARYRQEERRSGYVDGFARYRRVLLALARELVSDAG